MADKTLSNNEQCGRCEAGMPEAQSKQVFAFLSYCHKDKKHLERLQVHLATLKREGRLAAWHDGKITAGKPLDATIKSALEKAQLILLLVSPDFINSEYCYSTELSTALRRHAEGTARVIPIIVKPCDWQNTPLKELRATPTDGEPVIKWNTHDEGWNVVNKDIRAALSELQQSLGLPTENAPTQATATPLNSEPKRDSTSAAMHALKSLLPVLIVFGSGTLFGKAITEFNSRHDSSQLARYRALGLTPEELLHQVPTTALLAGSKTEGVPVSPYEVRERAKRETEKALTVLRQKNEVRRLRDTENDLPLPELPNSVYAFVNQAALERIVVSKQDTPERQQWATETTTAVQDSRHSGHLEVHKLKDGSVGIVGFVSTADLLPIDAQSTSGKVTLYGEPWEEAGNLVIIPLERIVGLRYRTFRGTSLYELGLQPTHTTKTATSQR